MYKFKQIGKHTQTYFIFYILSLFVSLTHFTFLVYFYEYFLPLMPFYFEYLATSSGKALLLVFDNQKYLFNCFEGFQRYSIESKSKISRLTTVLLPTQKSVIPFIGTYLTIGDMGVKKLNVITKHQEVMNYAKNFAHRPDLCINYSKNYDDNKVEIITFDEDGVTNTVVQIKPLRGKFNAKKAQKECIPREKWKLLCNKGIVKHCNMLYKGSDFLEEDVLFDKIAIIFNKDRYDNFAALEGVKVVFCFDQKIAKVITDRMDCQCFILDDARNVDYKSFYKMQSILNGSYDSFGMPQKPVIPDRLQLKSKCEFLNTCDIVDYSKGEGVYAIKQAKPLEFESDTISESVKDSIIFLGTGSALPSKYRNVTSILFRYNSKCIMLDCGEDTYYNICRYFGNDEICEDIETIFISHSHADHHLGAVKLISKILKRRESVNVICCKVVAEFIGMFIKSGVIYIDTTVRRYKTQFNEHLVNVDDYILRLDTTPKMSICSVPHTEDSVGIRIDYDNFSLAYSGDCRPSYLFTKMIEGVNVLINEATFSDSLRSNALRTKHTTVGEAQIVASQANVEKLILMHFSQRYPKKIDTENLVCAFDFFSYDITTFDKVKYQQCLDRIESFDKNDK